MSKLSKLCILILAVMILCFSASGCGAGSANAEINRESDTAFAQIPEQARVSYLGPEGTYTEEAAQFFFPDTASFFPKATVPDAIADVVAGNADFAVIPQENTLGGAVTNYVDALIAEENVFVVGEVILPISQTLMGVSGASIEDIRVIFFDLPFWKGRTKKIPTFSSAFGGISPVRQEQYHPEAKTISPGRHTPFG